MTKKDITKITSSAELSNNDSGVYQETENTKEEIKNTLDTKQNVVDTMEIFWSDDVKDTNAPKGYAVAMKEGLRKLNSSVLKDAKLINLDLVKEGVELALEKMVKNPEAKIILFSFQPFTSILNRDEDKIKFLFSNSNVKFIRFPFMLHSLVELFEEAKETQEDKESKEDILKTMTFKMGINRGDGFEDIMINELKKIDVTGLKDIIFIDLTHRDRADQYLQSLHGIETALNELQKNPEQKIIMFTPIGGDGLKGLVKKANKSDKFALICSGKNVRLFEYGEDAKHLEHIFDEKKSDTVSEVAFQKVLESQISQFLHDVKYRISSEEIQKVIYEDQLGYFFNQPEEKKSEKWIAFEDRLISLLQFQHPSFRKLPRKNNLQGIIDTYKYVRAQVLPEGTRFEGVYVDRDGTLYDNKKQEFNQQVIDMVKDYEKQGKEIIVRTQGNIEMKQKLLKEIGLPYIVKSKTEYKGGTVEVAIDNDSAEFLLANAKVKGEKHIQI